VDFRSHLTLDYLSIPECLPIPPLRRAMAVENRDFELEFAVERMKNMLTGAGNTGQKINNFRFNTLFLRRRI
jgi:hypothetical protein